MAADESDAKFARESLLSLTLPNDYEYLIEKVASPDEQFRANFRILGIDSPDAASKWVAEYSEKNQVIWRMRASHNPKGRTVIWKKDLRCERNTDNRSRKSSNRLTKNTNCPAKLKMTMKKYRNNSKTKKPDPFKKDWPCVVELINQHNHPTDSNPRFRSPSEETREKLLEMFRQGHSPTSAWRAIRTQLLLKHPEEFDTLVNDGRYLPTVSICTHLFRQVMKDSAKIVNCRVVDESLKDSLQKRLDEYANSCKGHAIHGTHDGHSYLALCTPLMQRAHTMLNQASKTVILDVYSRAEPQKRKWSQKNKEDDESSKILILDVHSRAEPQKRKWPQKHYQVDDTELQNTKQDDRSTLFVYFFLTSTPAGNIPLGIIICDNNSDDVFRKGLEALQKCFPPSAFFGKNYPQYFILNTVYKEYSPLQTLYPQSGFVLSHSYLLQSAWIWLCDTRKNKILEVDRHELYYGIRTLLNVCDDQELAEVHWSLKCNPTAQKYPKFQGYLENLYNKRGLWASFYCPGVANQSTFINNYVEIVFRVFKDCILHKVRASSINQLFDVFSTELESYMESTIVDFCYNRFPKTLIKFLPSPAGIDSKHVVPHTIRNDCYMVLDEKDSNQCYYVFLNHAYCSCLASNTGRLCKHISAVLQKFSEPCAYTSCDQVKKIMYKIAMDKEAPSSWESPAIPNIIYEVDASQTENNNRTHFQNIRKTSALASEIEITKNILKSVFERLESCVAVNPILFIPAIKQMERNTQTMTNDASLARAVQSFGQCLQPHGTQEVCAQNNKSVPQSNSENVAENNQLGNGIKGMNKKQTKGRTKKTGDVPQSTNTVPSNTQFSEKCSNNEIAPYFVAIAPKPGQAVPTSPNPKSSEPKLVKGNIQNAPVFFVIEKETS